MTDHPKLSGEEMRHPGLIGLKCGAIADIVLPHVMDRDRRNRLALALVDLTEALAQQEGVSK